MIRFFLLLNLAFIAITGTANAQGFLSMFERPMPEIELLPEEEFLKQSAPYEELPVGAKHLSYDIRIPKDWRQSENVSLGSLVVSDRIFSNLAKYSGPVTTGITHYMLIQVKSLKYQMTAKHWFVEYILETGYNVRGVKAHNDRHADVFYVYVDKGESYAARASIQISGRDLIFVQYVVPVQDWQKSKVQQAQVIDSFKLKYPNDSMVEAMKRHRFLDVGELRYPVSWDFDADNVRSVDKMSASLSRTKVEGNIAKGEQKEVILGQIDFNMFSVFASEGVDEEIENYKIQLSDNGLFVENKLPDHTDFVSYGADHLMLENHVFKLSDKHSDLRDYEFWITVTAYGDYYYYTTMLTPARENAFLEWARNTQAYRFVVQNFMSQERALDLKRKAAQES